MGCELLTTTEMSEADRLTIEGGTPGIELMETAGRAVADAALREFPGIKRVLIAAGPGNNGGDGYVAARLLSESGCEVELCTLVPPSALKGDALLAAKAWTGPVTALADANLTAPAKTDLVIDAVFGAGLTRGIDGDAAEFLDAVAKAGVPVLAVDVPSGIDGSTGEARGRAPRADVTVTFFRAKPGHYLFPGRGHIGKLVVADIGIPASTLDRIAPKTFLNGPDLWGHAMPWPEVRAHKYNRGHAVVLSGPSHRTGAARLAARGALRIGAGLVTVASPPSAILVNAAHLTAIMLVPCGSDDALSAILADPRHNAACLGPALGVGEKTKDLTQAALSSDARLVLDADALTSYEDAPDQLFQGIAGRNASVVLTPHEGEFKRLFPDIDNGSRLDRARTAAERSGAIIIFKGPDTVIAAPDGRAAINANGQSWLATAGSGDVLAGFVTGLVAQSMPAFEAAAAAVWLHGEVGSGPGMIATDFPEALPAILQELLSTRGDA